jgi:DNA-directed RNA polymerase subunit F
VTEETSEVKIIPLSEVKNILKKMSKERKELLYEQRIALEHAQKFSKLNVKKTNDMIKELNNLDFLEEIHAVKIADILPTTQDDVKAIFAKERLSLGENEIKKILDIVVKYYVE